MEANWPYTEMEFKEMIRVYEAAYGNAEKAVRLYRVFSVPRLKESGIRKPRVPGRSIFESIVGKYIDGNRSGPNAQSSVRNKKREHLQRTPRNIVNNTVIDVDKADPSTSTKKPERFPRKCKMLRSNDSNNTPVNLLEAESVEKLYPDHEIKEEMIIGPVTVQKTRQSEDKITSTYKDPKASAPKTIADKIDNYLRQELNYCNDQPSTSTEKPEKVQRKRKLSGNYDKNNTIQYYQHQYSSNTHPVCKTEPTEGLYPAQSIKDEMVLEPVTIQQSNQGLDPQPEEQVRPPSQQEGVSVEIAADIGPQLLQSLLPGLDPQPEEQVRPPSQQEGVSVEIAAVIGPQLLQSLLPGFMSNILNTNAGETEHNINKEEENNINDEKHINGENNVRKGNYIDKENNIGNETTSTHSSIQYNNEHSIDIDSSDGNYSFVSDESNLELKNVKIEPSANGDVSGNFKTATECETLTIPTDEHNLHQLEMNESDVMDVTEYVNIPITQTTSQTVPMIMTARVNDDVKEDIDAQLHSSLALDPLNLEVKGEPGTDIDKDTEIDTDIGSENHNVFTDVTFVKDTNVQATKKGNTKDILTIQKRKENVDVFDISKNQYVCDTCYVVCKTKAKLLHHLQHNCMKIVNTNTFPRCNKCSGIFSKYYMPSHIKRNTCDNVDSHICNTCVKSFNKKKYLAGHIPIYDKVLFPCPICSKLFRCKKYMRSHLRRICDGDKKKDVVYICDTCNRAFKKKKNLINHLAKHPEAKNNKTCKLCNETFKKSIEFRAHMFAQHAADYSTVNNLKDNHQYICDICNSEFPTKFFMVVHIKTHYKSCEMCSKQFADWLALEEHTLSHGNGKWFECDKCDAVFPNKSRLKIHFRIHKTFPRHTCEICKRRFMTKESLLVHKGFNLKAEGLKRRLLLSCNRCSKVCQCRTDLKLHRRTHSSYSCQYCKEELTSLANLKDHLKVECKMKLWSCDKCLMRFFYESSFTEHSKRCRVGNIKPYSCYLCRESYASEQNLSRHIMQVHQLNGAYYCRKCKKQFPTDHQLMLHNKIYHRKRVHKCGRCDKQFLRLRSLVAHRREMHNMEVYCDTCNTKCYSWKSLYMHQKLHPNKYLTCPECNAKFHGAYILNIHTRRACGKKMTRKCKVCKKVFRTMTSLLLHAKKCIDTDANPYSCDVCDKHFSQKIKLLRHEKLHKETALYDCNICKKKFSVKSDVENHECVIDPTVSCKSCMKRFTNVTDLLLHKCMKTKGKSSLCHVCNKHFKKSNLCTHIKNIHGVEVLPCDKASCNVLFSDEKSLHVHKFKH